MTEVLDRWEMLARRFEPTPLRWPDPLVMAAELDPTVVSTPALRHIASQLVRLPEDGTGRLMVFLPPQEGKSTLVSRRYPLWLLAHDPTLRIGIVSYGAELAESFGRTIKRDIEQHPELGISLRPDSRAAGRWETPQGGGVYCVGLVGGLTGRPLDVLIYDDVIKDRAQAESAAHRKRCWEHWEQVGRPRLSSRGRVIVMLTRWHTDDLPGRLLEHEGDLWRVVAIPALAGPGDPLGRKVGEELLSARRRVPGYFRDLARRMAAYAFRSIYQQRPTSAAGNMFRRDRWGTWSWVRYPEIVDCAGSGYDLRDCFRFVTVDLAASEKTSADWTAAAAWALTLDRQLICLDRVRAQVTDAGHWALVSPLAREWRAPDVGVESTMMGTTLVRQATRAGLKPFDLHADKDKVTRAVPYAHMVNQGQVWLPTQAAWLDEWIGEHADFPSAAHDDQVDVGAYAARVAHGWNPSGPTMRTGHSAVDLAEAQMTAALGNGHRNHRNGRDPLDLI